MPKIIAPTYFSWSKSTEGPRERLKFNLTNNIFSKGKFARKALKKEMKMEETKQIPNQENRQKRFGCTLIGDLAGLK